MMSLARTRVAATVASAAASHSTSASARLFSAAAGKHVSPIAARLKDPSLLREQCFINGEWVSGSKTHTVHSPTTGGLIGHIPALGRSETEAAIAAAEQAFEQWAWRPAVQRADILQKWYQLCMDNQQDLATILTMEQGKPMAEAMGEIAYGSGFLKVYAAEAERVNGEVLQPQASNTRVLTFRQPVGVVGAITPWNFPNAMITRKCGAALAAGCTVVLKPSEFTPYSAFALAELATRAGLPKGVMNLVTGDAAPIGEALTESKAVKKITFTGSTRVGKLLLKQCAGTVKRTSMELGGNAPFIVFDDADLDAALTGAMLCKFRNSGQTCVTANRIFVQAGVYDEFARRLAEKVGKELKQGSGLDKTVNLGPLINKAAVKKVAAQVEDATSKGAQVLTGGGVAPKDRLAGDVGTSELFFAPTVVTGVTAEMDVAQEETFGPVAFLFKFDTEEEVIRRANAVDAGLAAYFYTRDAGRIWRVSERLQYGMVGANSPTVSNVMAPFGGVKESGYGREGSHHGLTDYLDIKAVHQGGI